MKKFKESGTTDNLPGCGSKPKNTPRLTKKICRETNMNPRILLRDIGEYLKEQGIKISTHTSQGTLNKNGLECHAKVKHLFSCRVTLKLA